MDLGCRVSPTEWTARGRQCGEPLPFAAPRIRAAQAWTQSDKDRELDLPHRAPRLGRMTASLADVNYCRPAPAPSASVPRCPTDEVRVRFLRADPPLEHDTARAGDRQAVAARSRLGRIRRHPVVRAMVVDEFLKVGQKAHARLIAS